jgi:hypothetical protein
MREGRLVGTFIIFIPASNCNAERLHPSLLRKKPLFSAIFCTPAACGLGPGPRLYTPRRDSFRPKHLNQNS